jgi:hypothetical protein
LVGKTKNERNQNETKKTSAYTAKVILEVLRHPTTIPVIAPTATPKLNMPQSPKSFNREAGPGTQNPSKTEAGASAPNLTKRTENSP